MPVVAVLRHAAQAVDPDWPPVLIAAVAAVAIVTATSVVVLFRRFRAAARPGPSGRRTL